jgi:peptide/nickel transport system permease protein
VVTFIVRRLLWSVPVLLIASVLVFVAVRATTDPGNIRAPGIRAEDVQRFREQLGLDRSATEQYRSWLGDFVRGDFGTSLKTRQPVWPELRTAMWNTIQLGAVAFVFYATFGVALGVFAAVRRGTWLDSLATGGAFLGLSVPPYFFGLLLQIILVLQLKEWFGSTPFFTSRMNSPGQDGLWDRGMHLVLPAMTIAVQQLAIYSRYARGSMLEVLNEDYVRTARAKGVGERAVTFKHALRNAIVPVVTFAAIDVGGLIGGLVITEQIFEWPGMGLYFLEAMGDGDYVRILPWMMVVVVSVVLFNLLADLAYTVLDPRIRV